MGKLFYNLSVGKAFPTQIQKLQRTPEKRTETHKYTHTHMHKHRHILSKDMTN